MKEFLKLLVKDEAAREAVTQFIEQVNKTCDTLSATLVALQIELDKVNKRLVALEKRDPNPIPERY